MDANKIFGLFNGAEPESLREKAQAADQLLDYKEHPMFWVGMFKKLIANHSNFNKKIAGFIAQMEEELNTYDVETAGEFVTYNRAWYWISKIDITQDKHQYAVNHYNDDHLQTYLQFSISFWEEYEEYEKCAHLKKIWDWCMKSSI